MPSDDDGLSSAKALERTVQLMGRSIMRYHVQAIRDDALLRAFEASEIPVETWTHEEHLRVAFLYLTRAPFDEAIRKLREGIVNLNRRNGVPDELTSGYHETMTVAWAHLIRSAAGEASEIGSSTQFLEENPILREKNILRRYYSPDHILTARAKAEWVEPDLQDLPSLPGVAE